MQHENDFIFQIMYLLVLVLSLFQITRKAEIYRHSSWYSSCSDNMNMYLLDIKNIRHHKTCVPCWPDLNPQHCARLLSFNPQWASEGYGCPALNDTAFEGQDL